LHEVIFRAGDVIATRSGSCLGRVIRICTLGGVDHVGIVGSAPDSDELVLYEALIGEGVVQNPVRHQVRLYRGQGCKLWHYPLARPLTPAESACLGLWLKEQLGKPYDQKGAFRARTLAGGWLLHILPENWHWLPGREGLGTWFCSELAAAGLRHVNRLATRNVSEWSPTWLCRIGCWRGIFCGPFLLGEK